MTVREVLIRRHTSNGNISVGESFTLANRTSRERTKISSHGGPSERDMTEKPQPTTGRRRNDALTVGLTIVFGVTLVFVFLIDTLVLWIGWSVAMVLASGAALVKLNR